MSKEAMKLALEAAYLAGFNASGEGYNAEYPFGDYARNPEEDAAWIKARDNALREALAEQSELEEGCQCPACEVTLHASDCAVHNEPAYPKGSCDCGAHQQEPVDLEAVYETIIRWDIGGGKRSRRELARRIVGLYTSPQAQPAQQEPVAWRWKHGDGCWQFEDVQPRSPTAQPLYTSPPARKPLTDEEIESINVRLAGSRDLARLFARAIEEVHGITKGGAA